MKYTSRLDGSEVNISIDTEKKYGIMVSGGLDSAVLLYMLIEEGAHEIQAFTIDKSDGSNLHANNVIEHFNDKFGLNLAKPILVGDPRVHHSKQSMTALIDIFTNHDIDCLYNALNQNPPGALSEHPGAPRRATRSPVEKLKLPFVDLHKNHILDFMYELEQEDLIDITHTCTERIYGRCDVCWQCQERQWAFAQLNKRDTGIR